MPKGEGVALVSTLANSTDAVFASGVGAAPAGAKDNDPVTTLRGLEDAYAGVMRDSGAGMKYGSVSDWGITESSADGYMHRAVRKVSAKVDTSLPESPVSEPKFVPRVD
jgi:hypothetical protein